MANIKNKNYCIPNKSPSLWVVDTLIPFNLPMNDIPSQTYLKIFNFEKKKNDDINYLPHIN